MVLFCKFFLEVLKRRSKEVFGRSFESLSFKSFLDCCL